MVSNASEDLPEPDSPVITVRVSRGISTSTFLRLCSRAPRMEMFFSMGVTRKWEWNPYCARTRRLGGRESRICWGLTRLGQEHNRNKYRMHMQGRRGQLMVRPLNERGRSWREAST